MIGREVDIKTLAEKPTKNSMTAELLKAYNVNLKKPAIVLTCYNEDHIELLCTSNHGLPVVIGACQKKEIEKFLKPFNYKLSIKATRVLVKSLRKKINQYKGKTVLRIPETKH